MKVEPRKEKGKDGLAISVVNQSSFYSAVNLRIEACFVDNNGNTFHVDLDREDLLMLPSKKTGDPVRVFKTFNLTDFTETQYNVTFPEMYEKCQHGDIAFRVRVHAFHSFSGFGNAFEQTFEWKGSDFEKAKPCQSLK